LKAAGITHPGRVRENNEDSFLIQQDQPLSLFAVADGMGGHAAGEVASTLALGTVRDYLCTHRDRLIQAQAGGESLRPYLLEMLQAANRRLLEAARDHAGCNGMGTTLTLLFILGNQNWIGHIGDSRAYLVRPQGLVRLTDDHTLVSQLAKTGQISEEEKATHPQRHVLTQALGTDSDPLFDVRPCILAPGDRVLLCSDGLYGMVDKQLLAATAASGRPLEAIVSELVDIANGEGGHDNITVILVEIS
jgi:PPM family protein phosphatase